MKIVRYVLIVVALAGVSAISYAILHRGIGNSDAELPVASVSKGEFRVTVREVGYLKAKKTISVTTKSGGKITKMLREGTFVKQDEPFLWTETKQIEERIKELEVSAEVAKANLEKTIENNKLQKKLAELTLEQAKKELAHSETLYQDEKEERDRKKRLAEKGLIAEKELVGAEARVRAAALNIEKAKIGLDKVQRQLTTNLKIWATDEQNAEAEYEKNKRELDKKNQELEDSVLKAPTSGIIVYENMWKGSGFEKLQEGDQLWEGQKAAEVPDMSSMLVMAQVNEVDSAMVKEGQVAEIRVVAFPDLLLKGKVTRKATLAEDKSRSRYFWGDRSESAGLRTFDVTVELEKVDPRLREGMTANVIVIADTIPDATYVPLEAVFAGDTGGEKVVFVKKGDRFEKRRIQTGAANDNYVIVTSGVAPGESVALKKPESSVP